MGMNVCCGKLLSIYLNKKDPISQPTLPPFISVQKKQDLGLD